MNKNRKDFQKVFEDAVADDCDAAWDAFQASVLDAIRRYLPTVSTDHVGGSLGSQYFDLALPGRDAVCIRVSNHRQGIGGESVPVWSFETSGSEKQHTLGLAEVVAALQNADESEE